MVWRHLMLYLFKCRVCGFSFAYEEGGEILCPKCEAKYIKKMSKKSRKTIKKREKFTGSDFVVIGGKRCRKCVHSETTVPTITKCTLSKPEVTFSREKKTWLCYSFEAGNVYKKNEMRQK